MCRSPRLSPSTTTHYPGGLEGESKRGGGLKKRKELDERWRKMQLLKFIFVLVCIQIRTDHIKPEKVPTVLTGCCFKVGI